jgi:predicted nucleic acid-binding protein
MILLDTNVVSEAMTREPHPRVRAWLDAQVEETLFLSSITVAELLFGIGALPAGKRKDALAAALDDVLDLFRRPHPAVRYIGGAALCRSRRQGTRGRKGLPHARRLYRRDRRRARVRRRIARHQCVQCRRSDGDRSLDRDELIERRGAMIAACTGCFRLEPKKPGT